MAFKKGFARIGIALTGCTLASGVALAAQAVNGGESSSLALYLFAAFVALTIGISVTAARATHSIDDFLAAGGRITPLQNGLALAGDFMSAGAFLGLSAMVFSSGFDGIIYAIGYLVSWPVVMFLVAEPLRNLGRFTVADALCYRMPDARVRTMVAVTSLVIVVFYLIAQMVGAGQLIQLLLGVNYEAAVILVGALMIVCVMIGGMVATTWVQIVKAVILLLGATLIAILTLAAFNFDFGALLQKAVSEHAKKAAILTSQLAPGNPLSAISLGMALMFGTAGLPHILMRFFTVKNGRDASTSVVWATGFIGYFFLLLFPIGYGAIAFVTNAAAYHDPSGAITGGVNTVAIHLAHAVGGNVIMAFISAVAFATILAVVTGLTLAAASAISHDLLGTTSYAEGGGRSMWVSRVTILVVGAIATILAIAFRDQNVVYMIGLAFGIAASTNFPILLLSLYWSRLTTAGILVGGITGLFASVLLTVLGRAIWVKVLGHAAPIVTLDPPTLIGMPITFFVCWLVSTLDRSAAAREAEARFPEQYARAIGQAPIGE